MINIIFGMLGVNCAVIGCGSCSRTKGIGIFKLSSAKDDKRKGYVALATYGRVALISRTNRVIECDVKC